MLAPAKHTSDSPSEHFRLSHTHPLKATCTKFLSRHHPTSAREWLARLADSKYADAPTDFYGQGSLIAELEARMADLLGKPRALFCHKGMIGQLSMLKHWTQVHQCNRIAIQPRCHIDHDEQSAYQALFGMEGQYFGSDTRPLMPDDFMMSAPLAAVSVELPHRRAGFLLPQWSTLTQLSERLHQQGIALHFDGARLFESSVYWGKSASQVAALADSVYVSLYKLMGALAGGIIASDEDTIDAVIPWVSRAGGEVHTLFPHVISAMWGLDTYLPRTTEFHQKTRHVAGLVKSVLGAQALPLDVQTNSFVVCLPCSPQETARRALQLAEDKQTWLFDMVTPGPDKTSLVEVQVGDALDRWDDAEIRASFAAFAESSVKGVQAE